jgi:hypothetical protein
LSMGCIGGSGIEGWGGRNSTILIEDRGSRIESLSRE